MNVYKIQRKSDGLFSTGGTYPGFSKKGKSWRTLGALRLHLAQVVKREAAYPRSKPSGYSTDDCQVVEYNLVESSRRSVTEELDATRQKRDQKRIRAELAAKAIREREERAEYERLKAKFEGLPKPECKLGYTYDQIKAILGPNLEAFVNWATGQTMGICNGKEYDHQKMTYVETLCGPHGGVVYTQDLERFIRNNKAT